MKNKRTEATNPAAPGKGAITFLFQVGRSGRALPEQHRWAATASG
jgi:hypothetical protein